MEQRSISVVYKRRKSGRTRVVVALVLPGETGEETYKRIKTSPAAHEVELAGYREYGVIGRLDEIAHA